MKRIHDIENLPGEIWKEIDWYEGFEGLYAVSNCGRVMSFAREWRTGLHGHIMSHEDIICDGNIDKKGLKYFMLRSNGKIKNVSLPSLVWDVFGYSKRVLYKHVVLHKDGNPLNPKYNHIDNLELSTIRKNVIESYKHIDTSSELVGVVLNKWGTWRSHIHINKKQKYLGTFPTQQAAHQAYQSVLKQHLNTGGL